MKYLIMIILSLSVIAFTGVGIAVVLYSKDPLLNRLVDMGMIGMCAVVCAGFLWFWLRWIGASSGPYRRDKKSNCEDTKNDGGMKSEVLLRDTVQRKEVGGHNQVGKNAELTNLSVKNKCGLRACSRHRRRNEVASMLRI